MTHRLSIFVVGLGLAIAGFRLPPVAGAAGTSEQGCRAAKLKAAGKYASALLGCRAKAASDGSAVDAECLTKATGKLTGAFDKADSKAGTACDGLDTSSLSDVEALADAPTAPIRPIRPPEAAP